MNIKISIFSIFQRHLISKGITILFISTFLLCIVFGCSSKIAYNDIKQTIRSWIGKRIILPDSMIVELQNHPFDINYTDSNYKILTILDTDDGCTSCQMMLTKWEQLMLNLESVSINETPIQLLYVIEAAPSKELRELVDYYDFRYPIIYDPEKQFEKINKFPRQFSMRSFLLDEKNDVKVVGNPLIINSLKDIYIQEIAHSGSINSNVLSKDEISFPCKMSSYRIPLGILSEDTRKISSITIKNITDSTIHISNVITSCNCLSTIIKRKTLTPGSESELNIFFNPDSTSKSDTFQEISRSVYIYVNGIDTPAEIELYGYYIP